MPANFITRRLSSIRDHFKDSSGSPTSPTTNGTNGTADKAKEEEVPKKNEKEPLRMDQLPWDPDALEFPTRENLPKIEGAPKGAAWVWGGDDYKGRINLLTPRRVKEAMKEIKTGEIVTVNLPLNIPDPPGYGRESFQHTIKELAPNFAFDDLYTLNTQSGTQWDGLRHVAHPHDGGTFYNNTKSAHILPSSPDCDPGRNSIHHWAVHGIAGRGVLLDLWTFAQQQGEGKEGEENKENKKPWDPMAHHSIPFQLLLDCGKSQGIDIRPASQGGDMLPGDILLLRCGWTETYHGLSMEERVALTSKGQKKEGEEGGADINATVFAGVEQSAAMRDWLHDCYFAAVGGDTPAFECWPSKSSASPSPPAAAAAAAADESTAAAAEGQEATTTTAEETEPQETKKEEEEEEEPVGMLHSHLLALWGMPIGEMLDLEVLARKCRERKRWFFFFSSVPDHCVGGVGAHVNGQCFL